VAMTTSDRVLAVLNLFTLEQPEWTVEGAAGALNLTISTAYRYFRSLTQAGLLVAHTTGRYLLGPSIIQYDRQIRLHDPLITAAQPMMKRLTEQLPRHTLMLLCRLFRSQVMCVHQEAAERPEFAVSYERGRPMPLVRGAASKIILAHMPLRAVKALYGDQAGKFSQADIGRSWDEVKDRLRALRAAGLSITRGEVDPGMCGIAVPLFEAEDAIVGSLSVVIPLRHLDATRLQSISELLKTAARETSWALSLGAGASGTPDPETTPAPSTSSRGPRPSPREPAPRRRKPLKQQRRRVRA
jgi:DNA-binding IclR family transcriptional regulator